MFSLLTKIGFCPAQATEVKHELSLSIFKVPHSDSVNEGLSPLEAVETSQSFSCLDDVFAELLNDQVDYALSKW